MNFQELKFQDFWLEASRALFSQAVAGAPQLEELPDNAARAARLVAGGGLAYAATLAGELAGSFVVLLEPALADAPLLGEGVDQRTAWGELIRETLEAAAGELAARTGKKCRIARFIDTGSGPDSEGASEMAAARSFAASRAFELRSGDRVWQIAVMDEVRQQASEADHGEAGNRAASPEHMSGAQDFNARLAPNLAPTSAPTLGPNSASNPDTNPDSNFGPALHPGLELLLDVELEASLRFGSREMQLAEILELGPGDVVQLDRHVADPVDLLIGDKIVARGEVVLINGNFGLRVTEVAAPRKRLESIRCLF